MLAQLATIPPLHLLIGGAGLVALYQIFLYLTVGASRRKLANLQGCKPPPAYPHFEHFYGIDLALKVYQYGKKKIILQETQKRFQKYGNTYFVVFGGQRS